MFFCGPFGCSLTPSTRHSGIGLEIYSDPQLFAVIKLRPEPVNSFFIFWVFVVCLSDVANYKKVTII
jgi:hypothetical protein